jgi:exonuclease VII large subunit
MFSLTRNIWLLIILVLTFIVSVGSVYLLGSNHGAAKVQAKWDVEAKKRDETIASLNLAIAKKEEFHNTESRRIDNEFTTLKANHAKALAAMQSEYTNRLRSSEARASIYKRQSEGTASQRERLANYTTQLDRTLEEGRSLVFEFRETLGQCERQRQLYYEQITNDRRLF